MRFLTDRIACSTGCYQLAGNHYRGIVGGIGYVKVRADRTKNISQLRAIGLACLDYAINNDGKVPVNTEEYAHRSVGRWVGRGSGLRQLLSTRWEGGTGTDDYLSSPDSFYGPFTPKLELQRSPRRFVPNGNNYDIGYIYYSLPSVSRNTHPTNTSLPRNLANDFTDDSNDPRTPLLSDIYTNAVIQQTGYNGHHVSVVHLNGSVTSLPGESMQNVANINSYISVAILAGIERPQ